MWEDDPRCQAEHFRQLCFLAGTGLVLLLATALWFRDWDLFVVILRIIGYAAGFIATNIAVVWCLFHLVRLAIRSTRTLLRRMPRRPVSLRQ